MGKTLKIAAIPGDGIGKEVMPEACACWTPRHGASTST